MSAFLCQVIAGAPVMILVLWTIGLAVKQLAKSLCFSELLCDRALASYERWDPFFLCLRCFLVFLPDWCSNKQYLYILYFVIFLLLGPVGGSFWRRGAEILSYSTPDIAS